ncbi:hypothetical protein OAG45_00690 [bacterium]|jgi:hypothetical protein|nr:hypothetical protein [bacterium]
MAEIKHVGRLKKNQRKVVVAYRVIPGENPPKNSLVIDTATLSDADHDTLIKTVEGNSAQTAFEFAEVMARTQLSDGANMLARFHSTGKLQPMPMTEVEMTPNTATTIGLDELNKIIADQRGVTISDLALKDPNELPEGTTMTEAGSVSEMPKPTNPNVVAEAKAANLQAPTDGVLTDADLAAKYRSDADRLYKEAKALRAQAEELVPTVKKKTSAKATT